MNIWELTRSLAQEKTDLADQMARMTAHGSRDASYEGNLSDLGGGGHGGLGGLGGHGYGGHGGHGRGHDSHGGHGYGGQGHGGHGGGPGPSCDARPPLSAQAYVQPSPIEEESPRSGHSGQGSLKEAQLTRELQLLVEDGMRADDPAQDSMVEAILDALQAPRSPAPPPTPLLPCSARSSGLPSTQRTLPIKRCAPHPHPPPLSADGRRLAPVRGRAGQAAARGRRHDAARLRPGRPLRPTALAPPRRLHVHLPGRTQGA